MGELIGLAAVVLIFGIPLLAHHAPANLPV